MCKFTTSLALKNHFDLYLVQVSITVCSEMPMKVWWHHSKIILAIAIGYIKGTMHQYCLFERRRLSLLHNQNKPQVIR